MSVASRVAKLSHEALIELVVAACEESPAIKNRADALVAQVAPLPAWCVEVLLSPDLLSTCFSSLKLTDSRVAATCSTWRTAWHGWLAVLRPVLPAVQRTIPYLDRANGLCVRADGTLAVCYQNSRVRFLTSDGEEDLSCLRREGEIHALEMPTKLLHFDGSTFVADDFTIRKFGPDGTELASYSHPDTDEGECMPDIVVHPPSGALFTAVTLWHEDEGGGHVVLELDAATLQPRLDTNGEADYFAPEVLNPEFLKCVAVDGDRVLVTEATCTTWHAGDGIAPEEFTANLLHVLNLDGTLVRTIEGCGFGPPRAMVADQGRVYLIEATVKATEQDLPEDCKEYEWTGRRLFVIDIETGSVLQVVRLEQAVLLTGVAVHGGHVFLSDFTRDCVFVLNIAQAK